MRTPPLAGIEALLTAADAGNFRMAADRLAISASALSRRIQALESNLDVRLFERSGTGVRLTAAGRRYIDAVRGPVQAIGAASRTVRDCGEPSAVRLMAPNSIATCWVTPRLRDFVAAESGINVEIVIGRTPAECKAKSADVAILASPCDVSGLRTQTLVELAAIVVSAPKLANGDIPPRTLQGVLQAKRLAVREPEGMWEYWAKAVGHGEFVGPGAVPYETLMMLYEASAAGLGVALGVALHTNRYLREGRLRRLLDLRVPLGRGYLLAQNPESPCQRRRNVDLFSEWLRAQADASAAEFALQ